MKGNCYNRRAATPPENLMNYQQFTQALNKLKRAPKREVVLRMLLRGQTAEETAQEMGTHRGTVRKQTSPNVVISSTYLLSTSRSGSRAAPLIL